MATASPPLDKAFVFGARRRGLPVLLALLMALTVAVGALAYVYGYRAEVRNMRDDASSSLALQVASLEGAISPYTYVAVALARQIEVVNYLRFIKNEQRTAEAEDLMRRMASLSGSDEIFIARPDGQVLATSNEARTGRYVSWTVANTPCFQAAMQGRLGRFYDVNFTTRQRFYTLCAPVLDRSDIIGVVEVTLNLERVERNWALFHNIVMAYDSRGVVVASNRPSFHFQRLRLTEGNKVRIASMEDRFPGWNPQAFAETEYVMFEGIEEGSTYLKLFQHRPLLDWTVALLVDVAPAKQQAWRYTALASLAMLLMGVIFLFLHERRARLLERMETEQNLARTLEKRVAERTAMLEAANTQLRTTQKELVQAGKMAGLGQMMATLAHEFNQPVAAVRSYAENSTTFLRRGQTDKAGDNLKRIIALTDRMATLSSHLKNFARKPATETRPIDLAQVVQAAMDLTSPHVKACGTSLKFKAPRSRVTVRAGHIRLEQVIVNLITNAADAMKGKKGQILVSLAKTEKEARLTVEDGGAGISPEHLDTVFDPFFTTKEVGEGLGLGLSIAYNIVKDFGGTLKAENRPEGGARFTLTLPLWEGAAMAAETTEEDRS